MWEGETPLGNEVWLLNGLCHALRRQGLIANSSPSPEPGSADVLLPCSGARILL